MVELQNLDELRSVEELSAHRKLVRESITELNTEFDGKEFDEQARERFADLVEHDKHIDRKISELEARKRVIESMAQDPNKTERAFNDLGREMDSTNRSMQSRERNIYDLTTVRAHPYENPERYRMEVRDRALRALELARFANEDRVWDDERGTFKAPSRGRIQAHVERLMDSTQEKYPGEVARHIVATGNPLYRSAFWKSAMGMPISPEEFRALSLAGSGGGFAIPFALDPSIIPTSNSVVNPMRALARKVTISGANTWQGVTSPAAVATRVPEITEALDNSTTLVQPQITVTKGHVFVPFSIEISEDWPALEEEFGRLLQDAKDDEEGSGASATQGFVTGDGVAPDPQGIVTGCTVTTGATTGLKCTYADVMALEAALPPRFRPRESFIAQRGIYNVVRANDTSGGAGLWMYQAQGLTTQAPTPGNTGALILGRGAWEASAMQSTVVNAKKIMIVGDFSYFLIVDRIGITVELIPHIFGSVSRFPIGQRGLYAYYRNSSKVLSTAAFVALTGTT